MASHNSKATIWDVAAEAGVSITTVSRYMNGTQRVGPAASEAIERAIRKLDYLPNANVRSIKLRQTRTVAIIVPDISNFFLARVCRRVEHLLYQAGYALIIGSTGNNVEKEHRCIRSMLERRVDGLLISSAGQNNDLLRRAAADGLPMVLFESPQPDLGGVDYVLEDNRANARLITRTVLEHGHRKISFLKGFAHSTLAEERWLGFCDALAEAGLSPEDALVWENCRDRTDCAPVLEALRRQPGLFTAVIASTPEQMKFLVMEARRQKVSIPRQLSLTGFGIEDYTALFPFETTCILSDPLANADALVALILHRMAQARDGENFGEPQRRIIPCRFAQGDSVGRV